MGQEPRPLYGELAIPFANKKQSSIREEVVMEEQTRLMIEEAAYYLAEKKRIYTRPRVRGLASGRSTNIENASTGTQSLAFRNAQPCK